jgi:hypothetical protein
MPVVLSGTNGVTFPDSSLQAAAASPYVLKNRIINGDMRIDQRNAGASVIPSANPQYLVDRFASENSVTSKFAYQQNAGAVTPPVGFTNYLGTTSQSSYSIGASDYFLLQHKIEGYNIADLAWGTANAKTITLSFWVRSSLTGTFGGNLQNSAANRLYPFSYTISAANTWEQKSITIAGDTTGTWETTTSTGIMVRWSLGTGSTYLGTAGSWGSSVYLGVTGQTNVVGTNGATFYITGVQLEIGSTATPFERRLYNQELANCQRYYYKWINDSATAVDISVFQAYASGSAFGKLIDFPVTMRATPTGTSSGTFKPYSASASFLGAFSSTSVDSLTKQSAGTGAWTGSSGMTAGSATGINISVNGFIAVSAEL